MNSAHALVRRYFGAFAAGDVGGALACVHPDAVWRIDGDPMLVTAGLSRGRSAIRAWLERFESGFRCLQFTVAHLIGDSDEVIALGRFRHRVVATGAVVDSDYAIRFTLRDGLIGRYQIFEDSLLLAQAHRTASPARSALINGTPYGWDDSGAGPPLLFLHGLFLDRTFWSKQCDALQRDYRCVRVDMPGHGASGWRAGLDLDGIAEDIALWIAEHGSAPATLVGHSQGGMIALRVAARHPALVSRLILVNTSARAESDDRLPEWHARRAALLGGPAARSALFEEVQRLKTTSSWLAAHPAEAGAELTTMAAHAPTSLAQAIDAAILHRADIRALAATVAAPTLVLSGTEDRATPPWLGQEIADLIPGALHHVISAGHSIPIERSDELISAIIGAHAPERARP